MKKGIKLKDLLSKAYADGFSKGMETECNARKNSNNQAAIEARTKLLNAFGQSIAAMSDILSQSNR